MPVLAVKNATGSTVYLLVDGAGTAGDPYVASHRIAGGTPVPFSVVPDAGGEQLPDLPCKFVVLKNQTGVPIQFGFAAGVPLFSLENSYDEKIEVDNANKIWVFDADNAGLTFRGYAIQ